MSLPINPPDDRGFVCYCPECETAVSVTIDTIDISTGEISCPECGVWFEPEE